MSEVSVLLFDTSVVCYSGQHLVWTATVGAPMLLLYVIGIPVGALAVLRRSGADNLISRCAVL